MASGSRLERRPSVRTADSQLHNVSIKNRQGKCLLLNTGSPFSPLCGWNLWHLGVCEDPTFEELHNIEGGADGGYILTKCDRTRDGDAK